MRFKFKIQQYQTDAVENTVAVFTGQPSHGMAVYRIYPGKRETKLFDEDDLAGYRNHPLELDGQALLRNIHTVQNLYDITPSDYQHPGLCRLAERGRA